jgi:glycosyltransferase involved in cell wall biosynthesis
VTTCAFVSFRFGSLDGVSIVARQWMDAFRSFGFDVRTVAGEGDADHVIGGLGIDATTAPDECALADALADADLVVVENLVTIPLNVPAALATGRVLAGRPAVIHHHDPPWHRERYAHVTELPLDDPAWRQVTINRQTAAEMAERGFETTVIYNGFAVEAPGDRDGQRARLGVAEDEVLVAHPVRAIERKCVPTAIALAEALGGTYWLLGPAEEGYGPTLERLLAEATCPVIHQPCDVQADLYAAADVVAFPSSWEGFGNPPFEAAIHRRPVAVGSYSFASELRAMGFEWFDPSDAGGICEFLADPGESMLDRNRELVLEHFSVESVRDALRSLLDEAGWLP